MAVPVSLYAAALINQTTGLPMVSQATTILNPDLSPATLYVDVAGSATAGSNAVTTTAQGVLNFFATPAGTDGTGKYVIRVAGQVDTTVQMPLSTRGGTVTGPLTLAGGVAFKGRPWLDPIAFGADPAGVGDSTAAINNAAAAGNRIRFSPGTYIYNGTGIPNTNVCVVADPGTVTIMLGAASYLVQTTAAIVSLLVRGINTQNGKGIVRQAFTGADTTSIFKTVEDCWFYGYTGTAIASLASDGPYWQIRRNQFWSANDTTTKGVVFSGYADLCSISHNDFRRNRVGLMVCLGGNNCAVSNNNFMRYADFVATPRIDIWVVPNTSSVSSGMGLVVDEQNRFGNELLNAADYRIVYADIDTTAGTETTDRWPKLTTDSGGYLSSHRIGGTFFGVGTAGSNNALIYSTVSNLIGCRWGDIVCDGAAAMVVQIRTVPMPVNRSTMDNIIGPVYSAGVANAAVLATNAPDLGRLDDPQGCLTLGTVTARPDGMASNPVDYINQLTPAIRSFSLLNGATLANVADAYGGADAAEITGTGSTSTVYGVSPVTAPTNQNLWVEFEMAAGSSSPLATIEVVLQDGGSVQHRTWFVTTPSAAQGWVPVLLGPHNFRTISPPSGFYLQFVTPAAGKVKIGRVRCYQARSPVLKDLSLAKATTTTASPSAGGGGALPATPAGTFTVFINGVARQVAYY